MILRKEIIDSKEAYTSIDAKDALNYKKSELMFTSKEDEEAYDDALNAKREQERLDKEAKEKEKTNDSKENKKKFRFEDYIDHELIDELKTAGRKIKESFNESFNIQKNKIQRDKYKDIIDLLPYMDKEDIHSVVDDIINDLEKNDSFNYIDIEVLMAYLDTEDCDKLFFKYIERNVKSETLTSMLPSVSKEALSRFVDEYIEGKYQNLKINDFYPYLEKEDIRKLFSYYSKKHMEEDNGK